METQQLWRIRWSFKNATIVLSILNVCTALFLLQAFLFPGSYRSNLSSNQLNSVQLKYIRKSEEIRLAMQPMELIKRVREIKQEAYAEQTIVQQKETKPTAATDLSKRLKDFHSLKDAASLKGLPDKGSSSRPTKIKWKINDLDLHTRTHSKPFDLRSLDLRSI